MTPTAAVVASEALAKPVSTVTLPEALEAALGLLEKIDRREVRATKEQRAVIADALHVISELALLDALSS
ncbi:hypothetical protein [Agromyces sp. CF514]|uniref:hypothetical protein n=1 Tax=Agromyces sp. CF514 TaxID=1881031 RepID=UPI0011600BAF|nr:hypothetical protein [Agromyces sp. CF514]